MSKIFYFGGQKSGKTKAGSKKAIELSKDDKPYYVATYDNSYGDISMNERINKHILERKDDFICIEEVKDLTKINGLSEAIVVALTEVEANGIEKGYANFSEKY